VKFTFGSTGSEEEEGLLEEGFDELPEEEAALEEDVPFEEPLEELVPADELVVLEDEEAPLAEELLLVEDEILLEELAGSLDPEERELGPPLPPHPLKRSVAAATPIIQLVFFINTSVEPRYPELGNRFPFIIIITI